MKRTTDAARRWSHNWQSRWSHHPGKIRSKRSHAHGRRQPHHDAEGLPVLDVDKLAINEVLELHTADFVPPAGRRACKIQLGPSGFASHALTGVEVAVPLTGALPGRLDARPSPALSRALKLRSSNSGLSVLNGFSRRVKTACFASYIRGVVVPRDRLAAILVIVFAQQMEDVAALTWDRVTITAEAATITLADTPIELPPPLDEPLRALAASNYNKQTAAHPKSPWIFRGYRPGMHLAPTHLRNHLRPVLASLEARLGTLNELTQTTPIAILAETLGYSPQTLEAHAKASASTYSRYIATRLD